MPTLYDNFSQVRQYIDENNTSYVTKAELANASYVTNNTLNSYLLEPSIAKTYNGSLRLFPYGLNVNNNAGTVYPNSISYSSLIVERENSWASVGSIRNYVNGRLADIESTYATTSQLPVIDENLIPKENKTYTLGNNDYQYSATYTYFVGAYNSGILVDTAHGMVFNINGNSRFTIANSTMRPLQDNFLKFGTNTQRWKSTYVIDTYTSNLFTENVSYTSGKTSLKMNDRNVDIYANNKKIINVSDYNGFTPMQTNVNLGSSTNLWNNTYTTNLYLNNTDIFSIFQRKPVVIWEVSDPSQGLTSINANMSASPSWQLTNLDFTPYKRVKIYTKAAQKAGATASASTTPAIVLEMSLDSRSVISEYGGHYLASTVIQKSNDNNRLATLTCAISSDKTSFVVLRMTNLYGTAATDNADVGGNVFMIEGWYD